jgi:hypothetical protein
MKLLRRSARALELEGSDENIYEKYGQLVVKLEEDTKKKKLVIEHLREHIGTMERLDTDLSDKVRQFWNHSGPKIREWILFIKERITLAAQKIKDLQQKMETCDESFKKNYRELSDILSRNREKWQDIASIICSKVISLRDVAAEIEELQSNNQHSAAKINKIIQDYKVYKKDVQDILDDCQVLEEFENRVHDELDREIADISPELLELVNEKILENIRAITPRAEVLHKETLSIEGVLKELGKEVGEMSTSQDKMIEIFKKIEVSSIQYKLKTVEPTAGELDAKVGETVRFLDSAISTAVSPMSREDKEDSKQTSYSKYREIVKEMGRTEGAKEEICGLFKNEQNDFSSGQLEQIRYEFPDSLSINLQISRHPRTNAKTLKNIVYRISCSDVDKLLKFTTPRRFFEFAGRIYEQYFRIYNNQYLPADEERVVRRKRTIFFNCLYAYVSRFKVSYKLLKSIRENFRGKDELVIAALKNPLLQQRCFYDYQKVMNQDFIEALARNPATPSRVLNNIARNADKKNLELIMAHANATSFTHQLKPTD